MSMNKEIESLNRMIQFAKQLESKDERYENIRKAVIKKYYDLLYKNSEIPSDEEQLQVYEKYENISIKPDLVDHQNGAVFCFFKDWYFWKENHQNLFSLCNEEVSTKWFIAACKNRWGFHLCAEWKKTSICIGFNVVEKSELISLYKIREGNILFISPEPEFDSCISIEGMENGILEYLDLWVLVNQESEFMFG